MAIMIEPVKSTNTGLRFFTCYDDVIASIAKWKNKDYKLMYCDSWNFFYESNNRNNQNIIKKLTVNENVIEKTMENLKKFHGIEVNFYKNPSSENIINAIKNSLSIGMQLLVQF